MILIQCYGVVRLAEIQNFTALTKTRTPPIRRLRAIVFYKWWETRDRVLGKVSSSSYSQRPVKTKWLSVPQKGFTLPLTASSIDKTCIMFGFSRVVISLNAPDLSPR